jgi:hypothetical protein
MKVEEVRSPLWRRGSGTELIQATKQRLDNQTLLGYIDLDRLTQAWVIFLARLAREMQPTHPY